MAPVLDEDGVVCKELGDPWLMTVRSTLKLPHLGMGVQLIRNLLNI